MRKTNDAGIALIKSFESLRLHSYQDSVHIWTIGYGHTGSTVHSGQMITEAEADQFLRDDLTTAEQGVEQAIGDEATDNQFAACVSLAFNIGVGAFERSSIVRLMLAGESEKAAERFLLYNKADGKVLPGLVRRRTAERALFLTPDEPPDDLEAPATLPSPTEPAAPPQQTVESGAAGTQVLVGGATTDASQVAAIAAVEAHADEPPVQASTGGSRSLWTTITTGAAAIPAGILGMFTGNGEAVKWAFIAAGAVGCVYLLRMLILDAIRMFAASRPDRHNIQ